MNTRIYQFTFLSTSAAVALTAGSACLAASHCKGMDEQACAGDDSCTWVAGYTRKDGRTVSSHCKLKRGDRTSQAGSSSPVQVSGLQPPLR